MREMMNSLRVPETKIVDRRDGGDDWPGSTVSNDGDTYMTTVGKSRRR